MWVFSSCSHWRVFSLLFTRYLFWPPFSVICGKFFKQMILPLKTQILRLVAILHSLVFHPLSKSLFFTLHTHVNQNWVFVSPFVTFAPFLCMVKNWSLKSNFIVLCDVGPRCMRVEDPWTSTRLTGGIKRNLFIEWLIPKYVLRKV